MRRAIELDRTVDTITRRKTGQCHRTEKRFHNIVSRLYITGTLGGRDWYANPVATPRCNFHLKHGARGYLNVRAMLFGDRVYQRDIIRQTIRKIGWNRGLEAWVKEARWWRLSRS